MKIGIFGGTFDPPHYGHIHLAEYIQQTKKLDKILFVLSAAPPHKPNKPVTPFTHRLNMLNLAIAGNNTFEVSTIEQQRLPIPSYTYDTMNILTKTLENDKLFLIIGGDSLLQLHTWYKGRELVEKYNFIVYPRSNENIVQSKMKTHWSDELSSKLINSVILSKLYPVSSTEIRKNIYSSGNLDDSLTPKIIDYIHENNLYQNINSGLK
jgi:nicotinate-nucleotide adenylyltransferase